jgi:hypothetical protein
MKTPPLRSFDVDAIHIGGRMRHAPAERVAALASSIKDIGLMTPISVRLMNNVEMEDGELVDNVPVLIAGATRLEAIKSLGWKSVECFLLPADDIDAKLWEIDENLARSELTPAEIADHMTRRKKLWAEKQAQVVQVAPPTKPQHQKKFAAETAASTGRDKSTITRAVARGENIAPDVLQAVKGTDWDKGVHLDRLAKMEPEEQREAIRKPVAPPPSAPLNDMEISNKVRKRLAASWDSAPPQDREWFREWIDTPAARWKAA